MHEHGPASPQLHIEGTTGGVRGGGWRGDPTIIAWLPATHARWTPLGLSMHQE